MTGAPNPLITPWIMMLPTEIKLCWRMLGMAIIRIFFRSRGSNSAGFPCASIFASRRHMAITARIQLIPWHKKVAHATPATPMSKAVTKRISTAIFEVEEAARKQKGVLESPSAEKIPVAIL